MWSVIARLFTKIRGRFDNRRAMITEEVQESGQWERAIYLW